MELNKEQVLNRLRARITYDFKIKDLANEFGVSAAFMSMVLGGKREMQDARCECRTRGGLPLLRRLGQRLTGMAT